MSRASRFLLVVLAATLAPPALPPAAHAQTVSTFAGGVTHARGLAFDNLGRLYISLRDPAGAIWRCTPPSNAMTGIASGLSDPIEMVFDGAGNLYVTNYNAGVGGNIWKITPGGTKSVFASITTPSGLAIDPSGNLYVGEYNNKRVDMVTSGGVVTVYADLGSLNINNKVQAMYRDDDGTIYAGVSYGAIYKIGPGGSPITLFNHSMNGCNGITKAPDGFFYAASYDYHEIWKITAAGVGTLYSGAHGVGGLVNGAIGLARFNGPSGLAIRDDVIYCAEYVNNDIRATLAPTANARTTWGRVQSLYR